MYRPLVKKTISVIFTMAGYLKHFFLMVKLFNCNRLFFKQNFFFLSKFTVSVSGKQVSTGALEEAVERGEFRAGGRGVSCQLMSAVVY